VMRVSGADVIIEGTVAEADAKLLSAGLTGQFTLPDDSTATATITEVVAATSDGGDEGEGDAEGGEEGASSGTRYTVTFTPVDLSPEQISALQGENVRMTVPVDSTGGEVLAVPSAALTAGSGGESRVEVTKDGSATELVTVATGLAADGFVEITSSEAPLDAGDLVVVGK